MCDTFVAVGEATVDGSVIFGKNSDRHPNEAQYIEVIEGGETTTEKVKCTYVEVEEVDEKYTVMLSRPFWIWGAEMGTNEKGVVVGNEAVWTKEQDNSPKLLGMDILRLVLERADTAKRGVEIIGELLQEYGQGGNCSYFGKDYYDNSFIVADCSEAWVMETAGRFWIAERVRGIRTISNVLTIENRYDKIHPDLLDHAIEKGYCRSEEDFSFRRQFGTKFMSFAARADSRRACTFNFLSGGTVTPQTAMETLRNHNSDADFNPRTSGMKSPCLHASSFVTPSQTTASMVSHLGKEQALHWVTGTSAPCISVFKPMTVGGQPPEKKPGATYDEKVFWWRAERLHRTVLRNYMGRSESFRGLREQLEQSLLQRVYDDRYRISIDAEELVKTGEEGFQVHEDSIDRWRSMAEEVKPSTSPLEWRYRRYWSSLSSRVGLKDVS